MTDVLLHISENKTNFALIANDTRRLAEAKRPKKNRIAPSIPTMFKHLYVPQLFVL